MSTSTHEPGEHPTAVDALAAIDAQQDRTARSLRPSPLGMFLPWGLGYLVGFGGVWLAIRGVLPDGVVPALLAVAAAVPAVSTGITLGRSNRGLAGPSRRIRTLVGWTWLLGFAALCAINLRLTALGVPGPTLSLIWSGSALLVVGLLYLAGGALGNHGPQYVLGVWTLVTAVATVLVGYPSNFLVLALAGGGGFVVLGVWMHVREHR
ncbi:hypothetical protein [Actinomycetospora sp.]|uniref:hypothetical protein n=1 Tax=Actinomycetospora sp. TaxID=1872135 RepID=UPI002F3E7EF3